MSKLLTKLLCMDCKGELQKKGKWIICIKCGRRYSVNGGVIDMLTEKSFANKHNVHQQEYYDKEYEKEYANQDFEWRKRYKKRLISFLPKDKSIAILDLASGQGYMTLAVAKKGHNVIACDIATSGLYRTYKYAKKLGLEDKILFIAGDVNKLNFAPDSFGFIILLHVLEHMEGDKEVIRKLFKSSVNKCIYYIGVPLSLKYVFPLLKRFYIKSDSKVGHVRRYSLESLQHLFGKKGKVSSAIYTGHLVKFAGVVLSLFGIKKFDKLIENVDEKELLVPRWASNLTAVFLYEK